MEVVDAIAHLAPVGTFLIACAAFVVSYLNRTKIQSIHVDINSRVSQLIEATEKAARAEGVSQGEQDQRDRTTGGES